MTLCSVPSGGGHTTPPRTQARFMSPQPQVHVPSNPRFMSPQPQVHVPSTPGSCPLNPRFMSPQPQVPIPLNPRFMSPQPQLSARHLQWPSAVQLCDNQQMLRTLPEKRSAAASDSLVPHVWRWERWGLQSAEETAAAAAAAAASVLA
ncbi:unnamed protein product [Arctogadus glacialis]